MNDVVNAIIAEWARTTVFGKVAFIMVIVISLGALVEARGNDD